MRKLLLISCAVLSLGVAHAQSTVIGTYSSQSKYNRLPVPPATATTAGSVKIGSGLDVSSDGVLSVSPIMPTLTVTGLTTFEDNVSILQGKAITFHSTNPGATSSYIYGDTDGSATVSGTLKAAIINTTLSGTGNGYACINSSGVIYRSATACN